MTWSKTKPTAPGWYWMKRDTAPLHAITVREIYLSEGRLFIRRFIDDPWDARVSIDDIDAEYVGPIDPPT